MKAKKSFRKRFFGLFLSIMMLLSFSTNAFAAGVETLGRGYTDIGSFTFTDTNTTPTKTIQGGHVKFEVLWRVADGGSSAPNIDQGIGEVKLTMQVLDANTGRALTPKRVFTVLENEEAWYTYSAIELDVAEGQKVKVWFDASSVGQSNGHFRSIYIASFGAEVS